MGWKEIFRGKLNHENLINLEPYSTTKPRTTTKACTSSSEPSRCSDCSKGIPYEHEKDVRSACIELEARTTCCTSGSYTEPSSDRKAYASSMLILSPELSRKSLKKLNTALLADEALSWWETTTLTAPAEKITWKFFVEEFKKKYISEQYLKDRQNRFLHLKQANKPIELYVAEFCKYCKYGAEYIKTEKDKCRKVTDELNDELCPTFMATEIDDFQTLVNQVTATEAKMKAAERRKSGYQNENKLKRDDRPQWSSKKAKYHHEKSSNYTLAPKS
ncbi:hypothetical protein V6N13_019823 [Hibiscus sabdariffa]